MSELKYGVNVENLLYDLSQHESDDIGEFDFYCEDEQGREGSATIDITLLASDALKLISELKAQRDALAAENAALISAFIPKEIPTEATDNLDAKAILKIDGDDFHSWQWIDNQDDVIRGVLDFFKPKTPATDAYLNSARADAVQELADTWYAIANETSDGVSISDSTRLKYRQRADDAADFAKQLRAGEPS